MSEESDLDPNNWKCSKCGTIFSELIVINAINDSGIAKVNCSCPNGHHCTFKTLWLNWLKVTNIINNG